MLPIELWLKNSFNKKAFATKFQIASNLQENKGLELDKNQTLVNPGWLLAERQALHLLFLRPKRKIAQIR